MWRELISELHQDIEPIGDLYPGPDFFPGATPAELQRVERELGVMLPESLKDLLRESNGVFVVFGQHFIWSTDEIIANNREIRTREDYAPFDHVIFFADSGIGVQFYFPISVSGDASEDVHAWYPIGDEREWKAASLREYVVGWLSGTLTV